MQKQDFSRKQKLLSIFWSETTFRIFSSSYNGLENSNGQQLPTLQCRCGKMVNETAALKAIDPYIRLPFCLPLRPNNIEA